MTIQEHQNDIVEEFSLLEGDREAMLTYIMELGERMNDFPEAFKTDDRLIKGCQSKVWLNAEMDDDRIIYQADSNTAITKGLISLLVRVLSDQKPDAILNSELDFIQKIGMGGLIGSQRSNGLVSMIQQMKRYALVYHQKSLAE
jgi:cysteine desulfuration protein SufE